jgi:Flp pilus assembly protein TadB
VDYQFFQNEVTQLTNELLEWEENIDALDELAARITAVNSRIRAAQQDAAQAAGTWWRLATACGLSGALLFALGLRWSVSLLLGVGAVLLVLAGVAVLMVTRVRTSAREEVARARLRLAQLQAERDTLIPASYPPVNLSLASRRKSSSDTPAAQAAEPPPRRISAHPAPILL